MEAPKEPQSSLSVPICIHLRSKKTYFLSRPPRDSQDVLDGSGHCWCLRTMTALGPDEERVDPETCRAGRVCFESTSEAHPVH
jgi:hypothetical protein